VVSEHRLRLRYSLIDGAELRCPHCGTWWQITPEHWEKNEWHMCLPCKRERAKLHAKLRYRDAQYRADKAGRSRRYRAWLKENCPQYLQAYDRERKERSRQKAAEYRQMKKAG
jgi:hypothetical protein